MRIAPENCLVPLPSHVRPSPPEAATVLTFSTVVLPVLGVTQHVLLCVASLSSDVF